MPQTKDGACEAEAHDGAEPKRTYRPPTLKAIGSVRALTAKSGSGTDDANVNFPTRKPPAG
jgi:hypothetical protein